MKKRLHENMKHIMEILAKKIVVGYLIVLTCSTSLGYKINFNNYSIRYKECIGSEWKCVNLPECPPLASKLYGTVDILLTLTLLKAHICGLHHGTIQVCCSQRLVIPNPHLHHHSPIPEVNTEQMKIQISRHRNFKLINGNCGMELEDRISGGEIANIGEFPWLALLQYNVSGIIKYLCAGSLITDQYVLTAAHCLNPVLKKAMKLIAVRLGEYKLNSDEACSIDKTVGCSDQTRDFFMSDLLVHQQFDDKSFRNDIGLIRLHAKVEITEYILPVCLPVPRILAMRSGSLTHLNLTVAGWGETQEKDQSDVLMKLIVPYMDSKSCERSLRGRQLSPGQMCAGGVAGMNACKGDSGGPLIASFWNRIGKEVFYQTGIASIGFGSCHLPYPAVYTNVEYFLPWILDNMKD